jgi:membrane protein required for colicin V production
MQFSAIDIVFTVLVAFMTLRAAIRGFVKELLSTASLILGIVAAVAFSAMVAELLNPFIGSLMWAQVIGFLGIFVVVYLVVKLFENALHRLLERVNLESLDHALGIFLGILEGLLLVFILILIIQIQPFFPPESILGSSVFAQFFLPLLPYASELLNRQAANV